MSKIQERNINHLPTELESANNRVRRRLMLCSPIAVLVLGYLVARVTGQVWGVWAWIPVVLFYWLMLGFLIAFGGGRAVFRRWIAFSGCAYVLAWIIGLAISLATSSPGPTNTISTIGAYFSAHREAAMFQAYFLDGIAGAALIVFAAALHSALRRFEGKSDTLANIFFGAGIAAGSVSLLQGLFTQVLADHVAVMGSAPAIRTLFDLNGEGDTYKLLALAVFLGAVALLVLRTHALPRWLGWVAAVLAPLLVISGWNFALSPSIQYAAYTVLLIVLLLWVAAVSVVSVQRAA